MSFSGILRHPLLKSGLIYTCCDAVNKAVPFFLLPVLSFYLTPSDYGIIANFNVLLTVLTILVTMGVDGAIAVNFHRKSKKDLQIYIYNALLIVLFASIFGSFFILIFSKTIFAWVKVPLKFQLAALCMATAAAVTAINLSIWRLQEKPLQFGVYEILQTGTNICLSLLFIVLFKMGWIGRVNGMVIAAILFGLVSLALLIKAGYIQMRFNRESIKDMIAFGLPLIPHALSFWIRSGIDRIFITRLVGEAATGLYATGFQFGILISFLTISFNNAFVPYLYRLLSEENEGILTQNKIKLVRISFMIIIGLLFFGFIFIVASSFIIKYLFDSSYADAKDYIFWAISAQVFQGFYLLVVNYILFVHKTRVLALITFGCAGLQVMLSYILITNLGAIGGAYSTLIVSIINFFVVALISQRLYPMPWNLISQR